MRLIEDNARSPFSPFIVIDGVIYTEILDKHIPNIMPGQYMTKDGCIYNSNNMKFSYPTDGTYLLSYVIMNDGSRKHLNTHRLI